MEFKVIILQAKVIILQSKVIILQSKVIILQSKVIIPQAKVNPQATNLALWWATLLLRLYFKANNHLHITMFTWNGWGTGLQVVQVTNTIFHICGCLWFKYFKFCLGEQLGRQERAKALKVGVKRFLREKVSYKVLGPKAFTLF